MGWAQAFHDVGLAACGAAAFIGLFYFVYRSARDE